MFGTADQSDGRAPLPASTDMTRFKELDSEIEIAAALRAAAQTAIRFHLATQHQIAHGLALRSGTS